MSDSAAIPDPNLSCPRCGTLTDPGAGSVNFCPKCGCDLRGGDEDEERTLSHPWVGQVIADRYRLLSLIGEGGMGSVYKAEHIRMGKALALKVLRGSFAAEQGAVDRFRSEAQIVSRLSHPHTIAVFDFGEVGADQGFYLSMEYVPGKDLASLIREEGKLPEKRACAIGEQVLGALAEAHDAGIVHRDVKPANIMLMRTRSGEDFVKVLDFGIAKLRDEAPGALNDSTAGAIVGTPNYLAPEQARGESLDPRADLYSLGVVLYELVSGRCPFIAPNPLAVVEAHLTQEPPPLTQVAPGVSPGFAEIVHRALKKRPQDRHKSADDMRDALLALSAPDAQLQVTAHPAPPELTGGLAIASRQDFQDFERQLKAIRRSRVAAPLAVLSLVLFAALVAWRWTDVYELLRAWAPSMAAGLPAAMRPSDVFDGEEHEPNNLPAQANALPLPPGSDGRPGFGTAVMRGHIGAKISDAVGDVDVFRVEVPQTGRPVALHALWSGAPKPSEGIRGLDVALTLNRDHGRDPSRHTAPLVASMDRGRAGRPKQLTAAVAPGVYFLSVREKHGDVTGPVEKPTDWYTLRIWLTEQDPDEEIEPNDSPESIEHGVLRYPEWRELAERNRLGEGIPIHGNTSPEDPDTYAVAPGGPVEKPELLALIPEPNLSLTASLWLPDAADLAPPKNRDRVRFEKVAEGEPGGVLFVLLPPAAVPDAPPLLQVKGRDGSGAYRVVALGLGSPSGPAVLALLAKLEKDGEGAQALALAAGFAGKLPASTARSEVLIAAGKLADRLAANLKRDGADRFGQASALAGAPLYEWAGTRMRYTGALEALVEVGEHKGEEASYRLVAGGLPCSAPEVAKRAAAFLERYPSSTYEPQARLWLARALEDEYFHAGKGRAKKAALARVLAVYRELGNGMGETAAEAKLRLKALSAKRPVPPRTPRIACGAPRR